jgi:hypothetical protein
MSDDDETVIVMRTGHVYHTDETCYFITDRAMEWDLDEALKAGRYECGNCQADENLGNNWHGEKLSAKLSKADPDEVAPTELDRERASVSLAWFVAVWLAIMAASTLTGVMLYFAGVTL